MKTFIPIECDIFDNNRMSALINEMGPIGYGIYMILLVEMRNREDYTIDSNTLKLIIRKYNIRQKMMEQVLYNYQLFTVDRMPDDCLLISSEYVNRVMQNYDERIEQSKAAGKRGAAKRWGKTNGIPYGDPNGDPIAKEKNRREKNIKEKKTTTTVVAKESSSSSYTLEPLKSWETYLEEAMKERSWVEILAMNSGISKYFLAYEDKIVEAFREHILLQGTESGIQSLRDVKSYFANFIRQGTPTCKRVAEELQVLQKKQEQEDPYRHETVDPETGLRTYLGYPIPNHAPPRPDSNAFWCDESGGWI